MSLDDRDPNNSKKPSAVERYASAQEPSTVEETVEEHQGPFYKRERESRGPALALTLKLKNGNRKVLVYSYLTEMDFEPEIGIEMYFSTGVKVTIRGQYLEKLCQDLAEHRVLEIQSLDQLHAVRVHRSEVNGKPLPLVEDIIIERGVIEVDSGLFKPAAGRWNSQNQQWQPAGLLN